MSTPDSPPDPAPEATKRSGILAVILSSLSGKMHDYTQGSLSRAIALLAIPMVLELSMESVFALVDIWWVGKLGDAQVAAVGLTESMMIFIYAIAIGLAMATTAMVARRIGEGDSKGASLAATQAIALGIGCSVVIGAVGWFVAEPLLISFAADDPEVAEVGGGYARILFATNGVIFLIHLNNAIFRGAGDPLIAVHSLWLANAINLVLDPCLIFGWGPFPEMGVTGAAVATTIGRGTGVLFQFWCLRRGRGRLELRGDTLRIDAGVMRRLVQLAWPSVSQFLIATASWSVLVFVVIAEFGKSAVAGYTIALRIIMFTFLPSWGLSNAAATLVGQNLGAGKPERAEKAVWMTAGWNAGFLAIVSVLFLVMPETLIGLFQNGGETDADASDRAVVLATGTSFLRIIAFSYVFFAVEMVMIQALTGAGDTKTPNLINIVCYWMLQLPLAWFLAFQTDLGVDGAFWAVSATGIALCVACVGVFRTGKWRTRMV